MEDTIYIVKTIIENTTTDNVDVITKIESFYNSAWSKLLIVGSVAFAIVGLIVPFIVQWYQKRTLKLSEELLKSAITEQTEQIEEKISKRVLEEIEEKFSQYEKDMQKLNASANAKALFLQGKLNLEKSYHQLAMGNIISAAFHFIEADDHQNLQPALNHILEGCLPYLSKEEVDDLKINSACDLVLLTEELTKADDRGVFQTTIQEIKLKITKIPKTIKEKPQGKAKE